MSSCPSVRKKQFGSQYSNFFEIQYLKVFPVSVKINQFSVKSYKNNEYIIIRPLYICDNISLNSFYNVICF